MTKKNIWITGGTGGIGLATAKHLAAEGHQIIISGRSPAMEYIAAGLFDYDWLDYKNVHYYAYDVTNADSIDFVMTNIRKQVGEIDILINNAGIFDTGSVYDYDRDKARNMFAINTFGAIDTMAAIIKESKDKPISIYNILSVAAIKPFAGVGVYSASKAALMAYSKAVREEVRNRGTRITNIYPGATDTPIWDKQQRKEKGKSMMDPLAIAKTISGLISADEEGNLTTEEIILRPVGGDL
jgi:short-subunit dehydrogenase